MRYNITFDESRCTGCLACTVACAEENDIDIAAGDAFFRTVSVTETPGKAPLLHFSTDACRHCKDAKCIPACNEGCIFRDEETGLVVYDNAKCVGCLSCAAACPFDAPKKDGRGKMAKCHGCAELVKSGLLPACVSACPEKALTLSREL